MTVRETPPGACFLFPAGQLILRIREKSRKTDPERIRRGSIYSHRKPFTDARKYVQHPQTTESKSLGTLPREMTQISHSDASGQNANSSGAARYFDYESAVALRNLAAAYGTNMPRYLLAPEVAVLLSKVTDLRKRLFIDTLWNTGGRLNEILPLTKGDFVLDDPLSGAPLVSPFVVLRTLKQRRLEESAGSRSRRRGCPKKKNSRLNRRRRRKYAITRRGPCRSPIRPSSGGSGNGLRPPSPPPARGSGLSGAKTRPAAG